MPKVVTLPEPFSGPPPDEVPLAKAPLVRVLAQIRFPVVLTLGEPSAVAPFQERIRPAYPLTDQESVHKLEVGAEGPQAPLRSTVENIWRFQDRQREWRVSLAPNFLALETTCYTHRTDFLQRMTELIAALEETVNPQVCTRVGLRYIDRLDANAVDDIHKLIRKEVLGSYTLFTPAVRQILGLAQFDTEEDAVLGVRWGLMPPNVTIDPNTLEPVNEKTWLLDLDMYSEAQTDFTAASLAPQLESYAKRIYSVFRFMVTKDFLQRYGGK
jgi:uncharacterized protein (TIGR04255 family)